MEELNQKDWDLLAGQLLAKNENPLPTQLSWFDVEPVEAYGGRSLLDQQKEFRLLLRKTRPKIQASHLADAFHWNLTTIPYNYWVNIYEGLTRGIPMPATAREKLKEMQRELNSYIRYLNKQNPPKS